MADTTATIFKQTKFKPSLDIKLAELLELGMIQPSASPFGAAVMVIPKPGQPGKFRMVIDYRRLNALTVPDKWPLPDIGELLDDVGGKGHRYWCTFDLCSGFYNRKGGIRIPEVFE